MLYDHIDLRVSELTKARVFYDPLMAAMGYTHFETDGRNINYYSASANRREPFFGLMEHPGHRGDLSRLAFRAQSREDVDRLAKVALAAGASNFEPPENYDGAPWYYATFFEDPDGNKLEICYRTPD